MNVVLDTNVLVSALQFGGKPRVILEQIIDRELSGYITQEIIQEVRETLRRKFRLSDIDLKNIEDFLRATFILLAIKPIAKTARDPKDDHILAVTHAVAVDYVISGDKDLLTLDIYNGASIVSVAEFLGK